ncbi:helix-turn-helix domain-containing protein [Streptomyces sp. NPDC015346]|uniref:helix-turn-helix domain-containing protein n=1 Tax=Streptomyces sp. NPDC015346 TaxID=3364954 RepID=UPI0036F94829
MASQHPSAPSRASGLIHVNVRHTSRYTVVGNHLSQHRQLSLLAIGLAVHLQSLPTGAPVGIKALASEFPESEMRIAGAMRELEDHGYLKRYKERLPNGRIAPRTISYNRPVAEPEPVPETPPEPPEPPSPPEPPEPPQPPSPPEPPDTPAPAPPRPAKPAPRPVTPAPPPLAPAHHPAADLLAGLRLHEPRLLLAERDIQRLAPGVTTWLERGAAPDAIVRTLAASLPDDLVHPAGLLAHRLTALRPPPLPVKPQAMAPFQDCDGCDRPFRAREPGRCRDCRPHEREAA